MNKYGCLYRIQKSATDAQSFYLFVLREASIERLRAWADDLVHFGYDKLFTPNIISSLEKYPPYAKDEACI